jgi:two-component system, response regulator YesN
MHRVLIVEDEPAALRYVRAIVDEHCPGFRTVATAEHGQEAIEVLEDVSVDLIITDARMPVMDGIELIRTVRERDQEMPILVLSGYDDYEYVRGALTSGAVDYVLKPVGAQRLQRVLTELAERLLDRQRSRNVRAIRAALRGRPVVIDSIPSALFLGIVRYGGLPARGRDTTGISDHVEELSGVLVCFGRDTQEVVLLGRGGADSTLDTHRFRGVARTVAAREALTPDSPVTTTRTIVVVPQPIEAQDMVEVTTALKDHVDGSVRVGKSTERDFRPDSSVRRTSQDASDMPGLDETIRRELVFAVETGNRRLTASILRKVGLRWEQNASPLPVVRRDADECTRIITGRPLFRVVDDLLSDPVSLRSVADAIAGLVQDDHPSSSVPASFRAIRVWVDDHIREPVSVKDVADRFHLSASYVGKLFRRYQSQPLADYVNDQRVALACSLLTGDPSLSIKEIAAACGFRDQFYFSRVFKAHTRRSPSEYRLNASASVIDAP